MNVQELIILLKKCNPEHTVEIENMEGESIEDFTVEEAYGSIILKEF